MKNICIFGDSVAWGAWDYNKGGWVERLKLYLYSENDDFVVYNLGVSGDGTDDVLARFEVECKARNPLVIVFSIGQNDSYTNSKGEFNVPLERFEKNILQLIKLAKNFTDKIFFLGLVNFDESKTIPVIWNKEVNYVNKNIQLYDLKLKELVEKQGVKYLKISDLIFKEDFEDGVHLSSKGHEKLFNKVKNYLEEKRII